MPPLRQLALLCLFLFFGSLQSFSVLFGSDSGCDFPDRPVFKNTVDDSDEDDDSDDEEEEQENETSEIRIIDQFNQIGNDEQIQAQINDTDLSVSHAEEGLQDLSIEPLVGDLSELEQMEGEDLASTQENLEDISLSSNGVKSLDIVADYKKTSIAKLRDIVVLGSTTFKAGADVGRARA